MLGKLSIEVGGETRYEIVKAQGGVVALKEQGHYGFASVEDAHQAAKLLGEAQVGKDYTVEPITLVNARKPGKPGRKPGSTSGNGQPAQGSDGQASTTPASTPAAGTTSTPAPATSSAKAASKS